MQLALVSIFSLVIGAIVGFLYQKSLSQKVFTEKEILSREVERLNSQANQLGDLKQQILESSKAAMFETSREVSAKLLDDHKRENKESKEAVEKITQQHTEKLNNEFRLVVDKLAAVQGQQLQHDKKIGAIWQSLTSPVKASNFAEIGLENTLKNFGLEMGKDFILQSTLEDSRLRPDAIINLPGGNIIIIDAKTSKYFIELASSETDQEALLQRLKASMSTHLKQLCERDYKNVALSSRRAKSEDIVVVNVMYLPNDAAYLKVLECDPEYEQKCRNSHILLVTPASLHMLLTIASHQIARHKQEQNFTQIKDQMGKVISSMDIILRQLNSVGKAIHASAREFSKLSAPINSRLIPRIKTAVKLGLTPENELKMPETIPDFTVTENQPIILENDIDSITETLILFDKKAG